jgi:ABC-type branched-subunit amino acid transport system substrate-binding protein
VGRIISRGMAVWLAGIVVVTAAVAISTVATLSEGPEDANCPDRAFGCVETGKEGPFRVATLLPTSGPQGAMGREARAGAELALRRFGLDVLGHPVVLVHRDDRCSPKVSTDLARRLAVDTPERPPFAAVVGAPCPRTTEPAAQILSDSGIPLLSWAPANVSFRDPPAGRSFYVALGPPDRNERHRFETMYRERYGAPPEHPAAYDGFRAVTLILEALQEVAIQGSTRGALIPRTAFRDVLRRGASS